MIATSETVAAIGEALSALQGKLEHAAKSASGYGYHYADLATVLDVARPLLAEHGLALTQWPVDCADGKIAVESMLVHKSGEWMRAHLTMPIEGKKGMSKAQEIGSVITYARRYSLAAILGIAQVDDDAAAAPPPERHRDAEPPPPPPAGDGVSGSEKQRAMIWALANKLWPDDAKGQLEALCTRRGWPASSKELSKQQCSALIEHLQKMEDARE
jgi:hypothetical protein